MQGKSSTIWSTSASQLPRTARMRSARGIEHGGYFFGVVAVGKGVSRPMVQDVAEQDDLVRLFGVNSINEFAAPRCRAVNVGSNQKLQGQPLFVCDGRPYCIACCYFADLCGKWSMVNLPLLRLFRGALSDLCCSCSSAGYLGSHRGCLARNHSGAHC